jgi:ubiquitin-protein ligase
MNIDCINKKYSLFDNTICDYYKKDINVFKFIVASAIAGLNHPKRDLAYKPLPPFINVISELDPIIPTKYRQNDFTELYQLLKKNNTTDYEIEKLLGNKFYSFIKFTILSTNMILITNNDNSTSDEIHLDIIHNPDIEQKFQPITHCYFHGSNINSWYPILRNGIKNMSNTALMSTGAAYGPGVYLSSDYNLSFGYSGSSGNFNTHVTGIVQLLNPEKNAKISSSILVVLNDTQILLRSIIIRSGHKGKSKNTSIDLNSYYTKDKIIETTKNNHIISTICSKRLGKELKLIEKQNSNKYIFNNSLTDGTFIKWNISLLNCSANKFNFELLLLFSTKFPLEPPIICLTSYYYSSNNPLLDENGIILYDKISPKYWSSSHKLFEILNDIWNIMNDIEFNNKNIINNYMSIEQILEKYTMLIKQKNYI